MANDYADELSLAHKAYKVALDEYLQAVDDLAWRRAEYDRAWNMKIGYWQASDRWDLARVACVAAQNRFIIAEERLRRAHLRAKEANDGK